MAAASSTTGILEGKVTSATSKAGISGIEVCAFIPDVQEYELALFSQCAVTDAVGKYTVPELTPGAYTVSFFAPKGSTLNYVSQYLSGKLYASEAPSVVVKAAETTHEVNAVMTEGGEISGKVTEVSSDTGIAGISACAQGEGECALTNAASEYTIRGLRTGEYDVTFESSGEDGPNYISQGYEGYEPVVVWAPETTKEVGAALKPGGEVKGTITDASTHTDVQGATVCIYYNYYGCSKTDVNGDYEISALPAGSYYLSIAPPSGANLLESGYSPSSKFGVTPVVPRRKSTGA
jgi:hypothetical protein